MPPSMIEASDDSEAGLGSRAADPVDPIDNGSCLANGHGKMTKPLPKQGSPQDSVNGAIEIKTGEKQNNTQCDSNINSSNSWSYDSKMENNAVPPPVSNNLESGETANGDIDALAEKGMKCESKRLWEEKTAIDDEINWVEEMPVTASPRGPLAEAKRAEYAVLLRTQLKNGQPKLHSIVVQSPLLRAALKDILKGYPGIFLGKDSLDFESPFKPFVHRWKALKSACDGDGEAETIRHLELLKSILEPEVQSSFSIINSFESDGAIGFDQLWTVYAPDALVISLRERSDCAFKIIKTELFESKKEGKNYFILHCYYVDWDGKRFGRALAHLAIPEFEGNASPSDLMTYPLAYHPQRDLLMAKLTKRGKKFQEYAGTLNKAYDGIAVDNTGQRPVSYHVSGRIVIDTLTYVRFMPHMEPFLGPLNAIESTPAVPDELDAYDSGPPLFWFPDPTKRMQEGAVSDIQKSHSLDQKQTQLTPEQLLLCRHMVRGFSLRIKKWLDFHIDAVKEIRWNTGAFDSLALPGNYKHLLLGFAKIQSASAEKFDDVIEGKGRGMVVLLKGPPGVGKTLTVESVTEEMRVPLYSISAGELGSDPSSVQYKLDEVFNMAKAWKAVILLDEADIFLEKRTAEDLARNQLVSIFLQMLEYHEGTIFLTTNRVDCMDPAFESRIHISIPYPDLSADSRRQVWKSFLNSFQAGTHGISDPHLDQYAALDLNGREIKNTVKMAGLLALAEGGDLNPTHIDAVLRVRDDGEARKT